MKFTIVATLILMTAAATTPQSLDAATFAKDTAFLQAHTELIVLSNAGGQARVAIAPAWQGRVMTSTAAGDAGRSFGFVNRELIESGKLQPHINAFGGEDRFWLGPEGGQFSIYFAKGAKFDLADWYVPPPIDSLPFKTVSQAPDRASFATEFEVTNYSGTRFQVSVSREVRLLDSATAWEKLGLPASDKVRMVAFETDNRITNSGQEPWRKDTGLLSIWILGMFSPSAAATVVAPIKPGPDSDLGAKVTSDYFGAIPADRLKVEDSVIFLRADGKFRSKIGINSRRSKGVLGAYDAEHKVLTIVQFDQPADMADYVNSLWKLQDNPYAGDVANSYNDGPSAPGAKSLGGFFEMESSSPAAALAPGGTMEHVHRTIHLTGPEKALDTVARAALGASLAEIKSAFRSK